MDLIIQSSRETLIEYMENLGALSDILGYVGVQEAVDNYSRYQGKMEHSKNLVSRASK